MHQFDPHGTQYAQLKARRWLAASLTIGLVLIANIPNLYLLFLTWGMR